MLNKKDWEGIIYVKGRLSKRKVMNELLDYGFLMEQASKVYEYFTGLSKTNYYASTIISRIEETTYDQKITQDDVKMLIEESSSKKELIESLCEYFDLNKQNPDK